MAFSATTIREIARDVYGIEMSEKRAGEVASQVSDLAEAARRAGQQSDFNDELLSARQVILESLDDSGAS
ncbi:MAG: hypothetical protein CL569_18125 [Alphaproteobacteria bacterium]|nr:hypothetical protein [Alphaproteobacteria bacterium]|tara:strand:- start:892 stop:1101 length:210 start_codon:yes stop_codon:yes gene_type:complete